MYVFFSSSPSNVHYVLYYLVLYGVAVIMYAYSVIPSQSNHKTMGRDTEEIHPRSHG